MVVVGRRSADLRRPVSSEFSSPWHGAHCRLTRLSTRRAGHRPDPPTGEETKMTTVKLGKTSATQLVDARLELHWATQLLQAASAALIERVPDDSHTGMSWVNSFGGLKSGELLGDTAMGLRFADLALLMLRSGQVTAEFSLLGKTLDAGVAWVKEQLVAAGADPQLELARPTYDLPSHGVATGKPFDANTTELGELSEWFTSAALTLGELAAKTTGASALRCWPHHFDLATLVTLAPGATPERTGSVGIGFSPGDASYAQPYYYVSPWPYPEPRPTPPLLGGGKWHTEGFYAAVLLGETLTQFPSAAEQAIHLEQFLESAVKACRAQVTRVTGVEPGKPKRHLKWVRALTKGELAEGRVKTVTCEHETLCLTHFEGKYAALQNKCPHQGGPLGEGSIENGMLRCPWHGWDFHPTTGKPPGGYDDGVATFAVEERDDGVYVRVEAEIEPVRTLSDVMAETLVNWGVRWVFGMVGHSNLGLADALRAQEAAGHLNYIGIRHEGAASFACSAYGKLTGRPAACLAIAGPGATNLLTGLWDANVDRSPVIALTGQVDTQVLGPGAFQEIDQVGAFGKVAGFSQTVQHTSKHAELVNLACKSAILNRGVSHLIFPDEVQTLPAKADQVAGGPQGRIPRQEIHPPADSLAEAIELLINIERPAIIVGHGARFHMPQIIALAELLGCPVLTTFKGKGLIPDHHPLGCGVLGRSGTPIASWIMNEAEVLLVLGASFSNHTGIETKKTTIQVDLDPMTLGKFHPVTVPIWGEIGCTVELLHKALQKGHQAIDHRPEVARRWALWRTEKERRRADARGHGVNSARIFDALTRLAPKDAIIAVDVGNNTYSFGRYFECDSQAVLMSGYLGAIGFGFPAAMGAWAATQEKNGDHFGRKVICVSGDGGFGQYMAELTTAVKYGMNITHLLLNNSELGKISKEQRAGNWDVWQTSLKNPNFAEYAKLCGAQGTRVTAADELEGALGRALSFSGPSLIEVISDAELI